ncbi:MAG: 23S rRNA (adenine(2503)-C(2))-methyltransferase RlmN [Peptococcaceae bacterium]|nr:23S rRNA (adenine(2503)-C(2))-methyltransferase RlmN [Peptococcaceae bacterium]
MGKDVRSCSEKDLMALCGERGFPEYRGRQIFAGVHRRGAQCWDEIPSLGTEIRKTLSCDLFFGSVALADRRCSLDGTRKYLFCMADGECIETVLIPDGEAKRWTLCVSTQAGCAVGCVFCATGRDGFRRNLTAGEIVAQALEVIRAEKEMRPDFKIGNLVFMGMGEPFLNREPVMQAIDLFHAERGLNMGMRKMTISTCGVAPGILHLAAARSQIGLAVSLHSSCDAVRDTLVPMNKRYPLAVLMEACRYYSAQTHRRITFEMALTQETCTLEEAEALTKLLKGMTAHVNLIPVNPVSVNPTQPHYERPSGRQMSRYMAVLERERIPVSLREEKGADIEAACGQLRGKSGREGVGRVEACEPIIKM